MLPIRLSDYRAVGLTIESPPLTAHLILAWQFLTIVLFYSNGLHFNIRLIWLSSSVSYFILFYQTFTDDIYQGVHTKSLE